MDKISFQKQIGLKIKELRENKNISQVDLAYACNFEKSNMSRIEAGNTCPNIFTLYKIAQKLEIPVYEIFMRIRGCIPTECPEYVILNFYRAIHSYGKILHLHRNPLGLHRSVEKI